MDGLLTRRAFAVLTVELDASWGFKPFGADGRVDRGHPTSWALTDADQLAWLAARRAHAAPALESRLSTSPAAGDRHPMLTRCVAREGRGRGVHHGEAQREHLRR